MPTKSLSLAISPCPNDTYIFAGIILGYIKIPGIELKVDYLDIAALNEKALKEHYDLTKISYYCYTQLTEKYYLLDSGGALGHNCGPMLISRDISSEALEECKIAIPGVNTTANMLLSLAYPELKNKSPYIFSDIENAVVSGEVDLGLIIHENRFTYQSKGLHKVRDLGEWWESTTSSPIPLGAILGHNRIEKSILKEIDAAIRESILFAQKNPELIMDYILGYAQEMQEEVVKQHISLYVNDYSISLGEDGRRAVDTLFEQLKKKKMLKSEILPQYLQQS